MIRKIDERKVDLESPGSKVVPGGIYDNPLSDRGFKKLLASARSLTSFLNECMRLDKAHRIVSLKFKTKRVIFDMPDGKGGVNETWYFDIRAQTHDKRAIDIEVQNLHHDFFEDRVLIYGSSLLLKAKGELDKVREEELKKKVELRSPPEMTDEEKLEQKKCLYELPNTVCVWVCNFAIPKNSKEVWDSWMLYSKSSLMKRKVLPATNRIKYIFIELPNFKKKRRELKTNEDQWLYVLKHAFASKAEMEFTNDAVNEALERLKVSVNDREDHMISRKERECTIASIVSAALEKGRNQVRKETAATIANLQAESKAKDAKLAAMEAENTSQAAYIKKLEAQVAKQN